MRHSCVGGKGEMEYLKYRVRVGKGRFSVGRGGLCWNISYGANNDMHCVFQVGLYKWQILQRM